MIGKLLSATGEAVYTATETASLLVLRSKEIEEAKRRLESGAYVVIDDNDAGIDQAKKQEQVMMLRIKNSSFSSTASWSPQCCCSSTSPHINHISSFAA